MEIDRIRKLLESCTTENPSFPPTLIYNEGWLLRLVLDWFLTHNVPNHLLDFHANAKWFSEALLPSAFLARFRGDPLAESWTHADGVIGHFTIGKDRKTDLSLLEDAKQLVILEAKMFSGLSSGVSNANYYDQAARNVACVAEVFHRAKASPRSLSNIGFYVLAPLSQIEKGVFAKAINRESIKNKVDKRVKDYSGTKDQWYSDWFLPTFQQIEIMEISWEEIIATIREQESESANSFKIFYRRCIEFNE